VKIVETSLAQIVEAFRFQAGWCEKLESPLYAALMERIAGDVEAGGVCARALEPYAGEPRRALTLLRFMAALHRRALTGSLPDLARCYPSCGGVADTDQASGGAADTDQAWTAIQAALSNGPIELPRTVQTNEVTRSCALVPGFLEIAKRTRLPLRLLEIGCSAGLNLRWDRFRYEASGGAWGDPASPVVFPNAWDGDIALDAHIEVAERRGCDLAPVELDENGRLTLLSFVWPELKDRFVRLDRAIDIARQVPATLDACDAVTFLEQRLAEPAPGVATVLFHSIVWLYLSNESQQRIEAIAERVPDIALVTQRPVKDPARPDRYKEIIVATR